MSFPTDLEIAQSANIQHIREIADKIGIDRDDLEYYGKYKAKLPLKYIDEEKIKNIRHKFILHEDIYIDNREEVDFLTAIWCVKEALYKIHHSKHWSLKKHYDVLPFELQKEFTVKSRVYDLENEDFYTAKINFFDNYCFAVVD